MEFKGTKGEWIIEDTMSNGMVSKSFAFAVTNDEWDICAVWKDISHNEAEANAKLIATSPILLQELMHIVESWECGTLSQEDIDDAKKAITKALL